jgi:hypothetical protein
MVFPFRKSVLDAGQTRDEVKPGKGMGSQTRET